MVVVVSWGRTDLRPEFVDLGYELFRGRGWFAARFVTGNVLDPTDAGLQSLDGGFNIVHTASLFHFFGWDESVRRRADRAFL
ncbi:hypothetical protein C8A05DRAFT_16439 [Staphylotrichum tortipilum]|uniref:Uncharacterized protein n=1 Tax=Staphylotrichum tortipilum TaxID=2831512 RepID=A0AAN6MI96_9PEZI|nr:hypothetical protein C8A05DRAFT_16439 [Staphylotrichum longicolle]